jgi:hypothetical protein
MPSLSWKLKSSCQFAFNRQKNYASLKPVTICAILAVEAVSFRLIIFRTAVSRERERVACYSSFNANFFPGPFASSYQLRTGRHDELLINNNEIASMVVDDLMGMPVIGESILFLFQVNICHCPKQIPQAYLDRIWNKQGLLYICSFNKA